MQISLISSSFEPIQDQNRSKPKSSSNHSTSAGIRFQNLMILKSRERKERSQSLPLLPPWKITTTSHHRCDHDSEAIPMHKQRDTALLNPNVHGGGECVFYISYHAVLILHHPTCIHTHTQNCNETKTHTKTGFFFSPTHLQIHSLRQTHTS